MKRILLALAAISVAGAVSAADIDLAASVLPGNEAQFTQRFTPKGFKNAQTESGTVDFGAFPRMRWSYAKPEVKLFVFDGTRSWFYIQADKQVTVADLDESRRSELPFLLIGDPAARAKHFVVKETRSGDHVTTTLEPKDPKAMIRSISISAQAGSHLIDRVDYADREGNQTSFQLSGYQKKAFAADSFRFVPPAGVQVVQAQ